MKVTMDLKGDKEVIRALKKLSGDKKRLVTGEVFASGHDVRTEAISRLKGKDGLRAWDMGNLANSILVEPVEGGMVSEVGPTAPYGPHVEFGTKPYFPPPDALEGWAKRHGFDSAWPICKAIAKRGLKAKPFLFPAWLAVRDKFFKRIKELLAR